MAIVSNKPANLRLVETAAEAPAQRPRVVLVIPAYNEEKNIENVLIEIQKLSQSKPEWEIIPIIVNDGSTDQTELTLNRLSDKYSFRAINLPVNLGIGGAVQAGFRYAVSLNPDVVLQLDGDGQHPPHEIPKIVTPILDDNADVVVGSRYVAGAGGVVSSHLRHFGTSCFSMLLKLLVRVKITDATSGFRAFSIDASDFIARCYPDDYPEVQAYVPLARSGFSIQEVAVNMRPRVGGTSSITALRSFYYMIKVAFATMVDVVRTLPLRRHLKREGKRGSLAG